MDTQSEILLPEGCVARCNACHHRLLTNEGSVGKKLAWLQSKLAPWSNTITNIVTAGFNQRYGYRGKATLSAKYFGSYWAFGMWRRNEFIAIPCCPVHKTIINNICSLLSQFLPPNKNFPLAYLHIAEKQVCLVLKSKNMPDISWFSAELATKLEKFGAEALWIHLNPSAGHRLFEKTPWKLVWGRAFSYDYKGFRYGPSSFHQLIPVLYQQSLDMAFNYLTPGNNDLVIDLYCGIGHSLDWWLKRGAGAIGIESSGEAVVHAGINVPGAMVLRGQCHTRVKQLACTINKNYSAKRRLLYANPPRKGMGEIVLKWIIEVYKPQKIAYLSCSAGTLSKDLAILTNAGYIVEQISPFDFFPNTHHIETLCLLNKQNSGITTLPGINTA